MYTQKSSERQFLSLYLPIFDAENDDQLGYIGNISNGGLMLISENPIQAGTKYFLGINVEKSTNEYATQKYQYIVSAQSRWCSQVEDNFYTTGFAFINQTSEVLNLVKTLIDKAGASAEHNLLEHDIDVLDSHLRISPENQLSEAELLHLLERVETTYEHLVDIASSVHKRKSFSIAVFGSARLSPNCEEFKFISELTQKLVKEMSVDIVTGGGPGIMEAANQGIMSLIENSDLKTGKIPQSYGMTIALPFEEKPSPYLHIRKHHKHFTTRLQSFISLIQGAYVSAGGVGSLLEANLLWQLKQVNHLPHYFPLVLANIWKPIWHNFYDMMCYQRINSIPLVSPDELNLVQFSDDIDEIIEIFRMAHQKWQTEKTTED